MNKYCAFFHKKDETCNLFPEYYDNGMNYRFVSCELIDSEKCPYKMYIKGKITKEKLNEKILRLKR